MSIWILVNHGNEIGVAHRIHLSSQCDYLMSSMDLCSKHVETIGTAFQKRPELRLPICSALTRLCMQCRAALKVNSSTKHESADVCLPLLDCGTTTQTTCPSPDDGATIVAPCQTVHFLIGSLSTSSSNGHGMLDCVIECLWQTVCSCMISVCVGHGLLCEKVLETLRSIDLHSKQCSCIIVWDTQNCKGKHGDLPYTICNFLQLEKNAAVIENKL